MAGWYIFVPTSGAQPRCVTHREGRALLTGASQLYRHTRKHPTSGVWMTMYYADWDDTCDFHALNVRASAFTWHTVDVHGPVLLVPAGRRAAAATQTPAQALHRPVGPLEGAGAAHDGV